jgi:hypothetical protein
VGPLRATALGFQQLTGISPAIGLILPYGAQQASGTSCNLAGNLLTVGGTVTGTFATGLVVVGTGIPSNTYITGRGLVANTWYLSQSCTTETAETVTGYARLAVPDFAIMKALTQNVAWRDDGTAPTASIGMIIQTADPLFEYYGDLLAIQFIYVVSGAILNVSYYKIAG